MFLSQGIFPVVSGALDKGHCALGGLAVAAEAHAQGCPPLSGQSAGPGKSLSQEESLPLSVFFIFASI